MPGTWLIHSYFKVLMTPSATENELCCFIVVLLGKSRTLKSNKLLGQLEQIELEEIRILNCQ